MKSQKVPNEQQLPESSLGPGEGGAHLGEGDGIKKMLEPRLVETQRPWWFPSAA